MQKDSANQPDETVLLVDGEILVRHELAEYLRACGYHVIEAASTDEATTVLSHLSDKVDVVLCHAVTSGTMSAFELAARLRKQHPSIPVIFAGTLDKAADAAAELCDQGPHLSRPYEPQIVVDAIRQRLAQRERSQRS